MARKTATGVGVAIRRAREQKGLTQAQLATLVGKKQAAISLWEQGRRSPDLHDLVLLLEQLDLRLDDLLGEASERESAKVVLRAQAERILVDGLPEAIAAFAEEAEDEEGPPTELRIVNDSPIGAAQELMAKVAISKPPVPVDMLARRCGCRVRGFAFGEGISGLLLALDSGPVIGFNEDEPEVRQRFSIAHELGHHLLRHYDHFHIDLERTAADGHPPGYDWRDERSANEFAAQLLMPAGWVAKFAKRGEDVAELAQRFQVSGQAMGFRLANLGLR
jgi:Zn-dependent peptidase ImmA (M78 family)/transcriptional regulator with XRE-family HTH domain